MPKRQSLRNQNTVSYVKAVSCFIDIRGFTKFSIDTKESDRIVALLSCLFEPLERQRKQTPENPARLKGHLPDFVKPLGDGAMLIWEISEAANVGASLSGILEYLRYLQESYKDNNNARFTSHRIDMLSIGMGLSEGRVWKISNLHGFGLDYVGPSINQAARLMDKARPQGLVAKFELAPEIFMERVCSGEGEISAVELKERQRIQCWVVPNPTLRPARPELTNIDDLMSFFGGAPVTPSRDGDVSNDAGQKSLFELRASHEAEFASDLAGLVKRNGKDQPFFADIQKTIDTMKGMSRGKFVDVEAWALQGRRFHGLIAKHSHSAEGQKRQEFTEQIYAYTRAVYQHVEVKHETDIEQHSAILNAILSGDAVGAQREMSAHLMEHYREATRVLVAVSKEAISD